LIKVIGQAITRDYSIYHGDNVEIINGLPDNSIHCSIFSPPFENLYCYSNSERDMGNSSNSKQFMRHFRFLVNSLYQKMMPGRLVVIHCMDLPLLKSRDGIIGLRDFPAVIRKMFENAGFVYHSKVTIWKNPVTEMQRTKSLGLLHKQLCKDSAMSRQGVPDYLVVMRKPGVNPEVIAGELTHYAGDDAENVLSYKQQGNDVKKSIQIWQRYASPVWFDINQSNTLQRKSARDEADERHICPLQLDVIERCLQLWSNPGDVICDPFGGIMSVGYKAIEMGRKFVGIELKDSYFAQGVGNMEAVVRKESEKQPTLLDLMS